MAISRETIYAALFARLQTKVTLCKTFKRKWVAAQGIGADQQPALLCLEGHESPKAEPALAPIWTLEVAVVVYARTNDTDTPGTILSNILDQIETALELQNNEGQRFTNWNTTLGGLQGVQRAWIAGAVEKEDGMLTGGQGWMTLPVHILVAH
jgi:hypothetical protein